MMTAMPVRGWVNNLIRKGSRWNTSGLKSNIRLTFNLFAISYSKNQ